MLNLIAIAQSSPGVIAVNTSILLGYRVAGILGALITILGTVLPPLITLSVISVFYTAFRDNIAVNAILKGMQAGVAAVIANVVLGLGRNILKKKDIVSLIIMAGSFIAVYILKINVIYIILVCGCIGAAKILIHMKKVQKDGDFK